MISEIEAKNIVNVFSIAEFCERPIYEQPVTGIENIDKLKAPGKWVVSPPKSPDTDEDGLHALVRRQRSSYV